MLEDGAAQLAGELARDGGAVALDDDIEVGPRHLRVTPEVAHHPADEECARTLRRGAPSDRLEQRPRVGGQAVRHARRHGNLSGGGASGRDSAQRAPPVAHDHERRAPGQESAHRHLTRARFHARKVARDGGRRQVVEAQEARPNEVLPEEVPPLRHDHRRVALPRQPQRGADGDRRRRPRHGDVHEVGRH